MSSIIHMLKYHAARNIPLSFSEGYELGVYAWERIFRHRPADMKIAPYEELNRQYEEEEEYRRGILQATAVLTALHTKATYAWEAPRSGYRMGCWPDSAAEQIAGVCAAIFDHDIPTAAIYSHGSTNREHESPPSRRGFLQPNIAYALDNSGMGGDAVITANVSTIAAFIAAAAGIPMCKHGSPANADQGRHGSSDFIRLCGIGTKEIRGEEVEQCIETLGFGYTDAVDIRYKIIHTQTHLIAKLPHMNDIIGPITNPLHPRLLTRRVLGVNHLIPPLRVAEAYLLLNRLGITRMEHALIVRGFGDSMADEEGMDELSICREGSLVAELKQGEVREFRLYASDFGLEPVELSDISPPKGMSKGEFSLGILRGEIDGPPLQMVLANAALLFYLDGRSKDLKACYAMAKEIHESGKAHGKMIAVREMAPVYH